MIFWLLLFSICIFPFFQEMYNEHTSFLGKGCVFNIVHGKVSYLFSPNKEDKYKSEGAPAFLKLV